MITYFKKKMMNQKRNIKKYKMITTLLKSFDTFVIKATTLSSITLSLTGIGLIVIPISTASACALSIGNEIICEIFLNKYNKNKKQYERDHQTIKSFDKLYRNSLQDNVIDKSEYESLCNIFGKSFDENKNQSFLSTWIKKEN